MTKIFEVPMHLIPGPGDVDPPEDGPLGYCWRCDEETDQLTDRDHESATFTCIDCQTLWPCDGCGKEYPAKDLHESLGIDNGVGDADFCAQCLGIREEST